MPRVAFLKKVSAIALLCGFTFQHHVIHFLGYWIQFNVTVLLCIVLRRNLFKTFSSLDGCTPDKGGAQRLACAFVAGEETPTSCSFLKESLQLWRKLNKLCRLQIVMMYMAGVGDVPPQCQCCCSFKTHSLTQSFCCIVWLVGGKRLSFGSHVSHTDSFLPTPSTVQTSIKRKSLSVCLLLFLCESCMCVCLSVSVCHCVSVVCAASVCAHAHMCVCVRPGCVCALSQCVCVSVHISVGCTACV